MESSYRISQPMNIIYECQCGAPLMISISPICRNIRIQSILPQKLDVEKCTGNINSSGSSSMSESIIPYHLKDLCRYCSIRNQSQNNGNNYNNNNSNKGSFVHNVDKQIDNNDYKRTNILDAAACSINKVNKSQEQCKTMVNTENVDDMLLSDIKTYFR